MQQSTEKKEKSLYRLMISFPGRSGLSLKMLEPLGQLGKAQLRERFQRWFISPCPGVLLTVTFCSLSREWLQSISRGCTWAGSSRAWAAHAPLAQIILIHQELTVYIIQLILGVRVQLGIKTHAQGLCH